MAVTVVTTVGSASANSYASVTEADAELEAHPDVATWTALTDPEKGRALILATQRIDQEPFEGSTVNPLPGTSDEAAQALKFPRNGCTSDEGWTYQNDVIPEPIKKATIHLALDIAAGGVSLTDEGLEGFEEVAVGPLSVTPRHSRKSGSLSAQVRRFLRMAGWVGSNGLQFDIARA
jgi:hypothetical protein